MAFDNSMLEIIRQSLANNESHEGSSEQISIISEVVDNIKLLTEITPKPSPEDIICHIGEHHIKYASREYFGHVLVLDYKVNPFEIYAIVSATDLWHINQYFGTTFSVCDSTPYDQIKDTLKHLSSLESISISGGSFISSIASYYKTHLDEYDDLITNYISSPLDYLEGLCDYGLDYLMKANHCKGLDYIKQLQDTASPILNNLAAHMLIHVVNNYLSYATNHVKKAIDQLQTIDYSAANNQPFIRNCQALLIATYRNTASEEDRAKINKLIYDTADRSEEAHYVLSHEIALDVHRSDNEIHLNFADYLKFIARIKTLNNAAIIDNIDLILAWALEQLSAELVWSCIIAIGSQNKCSSLERLDSTLYEITKNISKHLPFIYSNIFSSKSMHNVGLKVLQNLSFHDENDYSFASIRNDDDFFGMDTLLFHQVFHLGGHGSGFAGTCTGNQQTVVIVCDDCTALFFIQLDNGINIFEDVIEIFFLLRQHTIHIVGIVGNDIAAQGVHFGQERF